MKTTLLAAMISLTALASALSPAQAAYRGPHDVLALNGNEYAIMVTSTGAARTIKVFRAMGQSTWQYIGTTSIEAGQRASNGSIVQNIYFSGRKVRTVSGDLRIPFYRLFPGDGGDRVR